MASTVVKNTTAGYKIGTAADQKVGLFGATPVVQPASANQAAITPTIGGALATTAATTSTPYGFSQAQADGLIARVNQLLADVAALTTLCHAQRTALVALGAIKGAA